LRATEFKIETFDDVVNYFVYLSLVLKREVLIFYFLNRITINSTTGTGKKLTVN